MSVARLSWLCGGLLTAGFLVVTGGVFLFHVNAPQAGEPPAKPPAKPDTPEGFPAPPKKLSPEEYRKKYPFESVVERLAYEEELAKELKKSGDAPPLGADARKR